MPRPGHSSCASWKEQILNKHNHKSHRTLPAYEGAGFTSPPILVNVDVWAGATADLERALDALDTAYNEVRDDLIRRKNRGAA